MIIGISGKKQSGKSTLAQGLSGKFDNAPVVCFADRLRELVAELFASPVQNSYLDPVVLQDEKVKQSKHPCGKTYRQLLQIIGTDYFRNLWPDVWLENYKYQIATMYPHYPYVLTPDVRFPNEADMIHSLGGLVIRLTRNPFDDKHESETALDNYKDFDLTIDNRDMTIPVTIAVANEWLKGQKK
jgi:hypothetical protein